MTTFTSSSYIFSHGIVTGIQISFTFTLKLVLTYERESNGDAAGAEEGGGGAVTKSTEGGGGDSFDVAVQEESSLGLTSVVSPTGYSRTRGLMARECCKKAT